ncbi:hypothetical protein [Pilimelia anulata]|nr:hypothetical protein [Pilimelia anulata]
MFVELTHPRNKLGEFVGDSRGQVAAHGLAIEVQRLADRGGSDAFAVQGVNLSVSLPGQLGPPAAVAPLRRLGRRGGFLWGLLA